MIIISYIFPYAISKSQAIYSIFPVIGTVLIIVFYKDNGFINSLSKNKIISILGFSSYSIYYINHY